MDVPTQPAIDSASRVLRRDADGLVIALYDAAEDAEARQLDQLAAQGRAYRISHRRSTFQRRAENFTRHFIVTARLDGRLAGVAAVALKDVVLHGEPLTAAYHFDYRVHPALRRQQVGQRMRSALEHLAAPAALHYTYVIEDNRAGLRLAAERGARDTTYVGYLAYPCFRTHPLREAAQEVSLAEMHANLLRHAPRFDFYSDPAQGGSTAGHVGSWLLQRGHQLAGCSAWDRSAIMTEVLEAFPWHLRLLRRALGLVPESIPVPRVPAVGVPIRSLYLFDFFASDPELARELLAHANNVARERGIDCCYVVHLASDPWVSALRGQLPRVITPTVRYRLFSVGTRAPLRPIVRPYLDIRDV